MRQGCHVELTWVTHSGFCLLINPYIQHVKVLYHTDHFNLCHIHGIKSKQFFFHGNRTIRDGCEVVPGYGDYVLRYVACVLLLSLFSIHRIYYWLSIVYSNTELPDMYKDPWMLINMYVWSNLFPALKPWIWTASSSYNK
jgi:hypothetical protein